MNEWETVLIDGYIKQRKENKYPFVGCIKLKNAKDKWPNVWKYINKEALKFCGVVVFNSKFEKELGV